MRLAIVDIGLSNMGSVVNMLRYLEYEPIVAADAESVAAADKVLLPGVGHYDTAMQTLSVRGIVSALGDHVSRGRPLLGVCLGMQLLFEGSEEGTLPGLGFLSGVCARLQADPTRGVRVPHMGWNRVDYIRPFPIPDESEGHWYYFVHSYAVPASHPHAVGLTEHGGRFASAVSDGQVAGVQFHPEKSHRFGMELLRGWLAS